jgi:hypothetical protein
MKGGYAMKSVILKSKDVEAADNLEIILKKAEGI